MELASKLVAYRNNRQKLLEILQRIYRENNMKFLKIERDGIAIDIDPFRVFGMFNKGITKDNRILILEGIAKEFDIKRDVPSDFDGIPVLNNQNSLFLYFKDDRQPEDIDNPWDIFEEAIKYADNPEQRTISNIADYYDKVIGQLGVKWNITMGLYWIRPYIFVNLDSKNRDFLISEKLIDNNIFDNLGKLKRLPTGKDYFLLCEYLRMKFNEKKYEYHSFPELSLAAWTATKKNKKETDIELENDNNSETTYWSSKEEYDPGLTVNDWVTFLKEDKKRYLATLELLKALLELGGEATCTSVGELLGEHPTACSSRGNTLGKRVKNKYNLLPCMDGEKERYFPIPFVGRYVYENGVKLYSWKLRNELKAALESMNLGEVNTLEQVTDINKNTILYGPPGTGKTYNTVVYAVAIIENKKLQAVKDEDYLEVFERYNTYESKGLIEFTTFHQSYGYEKFIAGIKPVMDHYDKNYSDIQYELSSGLFKSFCEKASCQSIRLNSEVIQLNNSLSAWSINLDNVSSNSTYEECIKNDYIKLEYDDIKNDEMIFSIDKQQIIYDFKYNIQIGDIVLLCSNTSSINAIGIVTGEYSCHKEYENISILRKVSWFFKNLNTKINEINDKFILPLVPIAKLDLSYLDVIDLITQLADDTIEIKENNHNYVFVIDEINRGNISKIFGELITLIETTKRIGEPEAMEVRLPYSQKLFGIPNNVYIIGTMNTADRSIATIDTVLCRRFNFKEMLPDMSVLEGIYVDDVSIKDIVSKMNKRISVLYDREHTIGHAYFLALKENPTVEILGRIFFNKIIPLLQEYFYEDYEKIRLVLGDNNKNNSDDQFIIKVVNDYSELFGNIEFQFDETYTYEINDLAFENIESYRQI